MSRGSLQQETSKGKKGHIADKGKEDFFVNRADSIQTTTLKHNRQNSSENLQLKD